MAHTHISQHASTAHRAAHRASPPLIAIDGVYDEVCAGGVGNTAFVMRTLDGVSLTVRSGELVLLHGGVASGAASLMTLLNGNRTPRRGTRRVATGVQLRHGRISGNAAAGIVHGWLKGGTDAKPPANGRVVYMLRVRTDRNAATILSPELADRTAHSADAFHVWAAWATALKAQGCSVVLQVGDHPMVSFASRSARVASEPYPLSHRALPDQHAVYEPAAVPPHRRSRSQRLERSRFAEVANRAIRHIQPRPNPDGFRILTMALGRIVKEEVSRDSTDPIHSIANPSYGPAFYGPTVPVPTPVAIMPEFRLYNTLTRRVEPFAPADGHTVRMYTCGPTVYNPAHLGNFRTFLFEDLLRRAFRLAGWQVQQVMNLTDVDDKIIRKAAETGQSITEVTAPYTALFHQDRKYLRIEDAEVYPKATEHIPEMIALVERLVANGVAYSADDGTVYFSIDKFADYGKLSQLDKRELRTGAGGRVLQDEYAKENAQDFALWKAAKAEDEATGAAWDSPWGRGRPGWHLECSAMAMKYLGETFDLHAGGIDLIFPHHEDEIAQSEAATGKTFARCWCHGEFLLTDGSKMAKRVGNVANVVELREQRISGTVYRHFVFSAHYRQQLNMGDDALEASQTAVRRIGTFAERLLTASGGTPALAEAATKAESAFIEALYDDLNAPRGMAALFTFITEANRELDVGGTDVAALERARAAFRLMDSVLDLVPDNTLEAELEGWATERLAARQAARERRDFQSADAIRDEMLARGILIEDTANGTRWRRM